MVGGRGHLRCAQVQAMKKVARLHTCVAVATVSPPPSTSRTERATSPARYSVPQLSPPHPVSRRVNPTATPNSEPAPRARPGPSRVPVPNPQTPAGCVHARPPTCTRVASPPHPASLLAAPTVPTRRQTPPPGRPPHARRRPLTC